LRLAVCNRDSIRGSYLYGYGGVVEAEPGQVDAAHKALRQEPLNEIGGDRCMLGPRSLVVLKGKVFFI